MARGKYEYWLTEDGLILLEGWARDGLTDKQISHNIGISEQTLNVWKNKYPSFSESLKKGKEIVDMEVENALLKKATGYTIQLNKQKVTKDGDVVDIVEEIHITPDTTAQIFWLKNRKPDKWRDKPVNDNDREALEKLDKIMKALDDETEC